MTLTINTRQQQQHEQHGQHQRHNGNCNTASSSRLLRQTKGSGCICICIRHCSPWIGLDVATTTTAAAKATATSCCHSGKSGSSRHAFIAHWVSDSHSKSQKGLVGLCTSTLREMRDSLLWKLKSLHFCELPLYIYINFYRNYACVLSEFTATTLTLK